MRNKGRDSLKHLLHAVPAHCTRFEFLTFSHFKNFQLTKLTMPFFINKAPTPSLSKIGSVR